MRVVITNDDGITSYGLTLLAHVAADAGHDVLVAAPNREYSGYSAALSGEGNGGFKQSAGRPPGLREGIESIAVHGSPALIAYGAGLGAFGPRPDLLLSGVNLGPNVGPAVVHSGTVGAAMTASAQGIPAMATSILSADPQHWDTASAVIGAAFAWLVAHPQDDRVLNVNVPDVSLADLRGLRAAPLARYGPALDVVTRQVEQMFFDPHGTPNEHFEPDSDAGLLAQGWATMSLLRTHSHDAAEATLPTFTAGAGR